MNKADAPCRLVIEFKQGESIFIEMGQEKVEIRLANNSPEKKARLFFSAPKHIPIRRVWSKRDAD